MYRYSSLRIFLLLTAAAVLFPSMSATAEELFFIPGWRTGFSARTGSVRIMKCIYPAKKISVKSWDSAVPYEEAVQNSFEHSGKLLDELLAMPEVRRRELILIGHSIGARIVLELLSALAERGLKIRHAVLLAAACPEDEPMLWRALDAVEGRFINLYSPEDSILGVIYPATEGHYALGARGWRFSDPRLLESRIDWDGASFMHHFAYLYLEALGRFWLNLPERLPDIKVLNGLPEPYRFADADDIYWETVEQLSLWKAQRHFSGKKYRIVDPAGFLRAQMTTQKSLQAVFADIRSQLNAAEQK